MSLSLPSVPPIGLFGVPNSETGRLLLHTDWSESPLGPPASWPQSLRIAVSICLNSRFPMFVWWGESLVNIYNDAYAPILGKRHPAAFGRSAREVWADIWGVLEPQVEDVMHRGSATWNERALLVMERNDFEEETYFTWSYSPIWREDGRIGGLFCACTEETSRIAAERERDRLIRDAQDTATTLQTWFNNAPGYIALLRGPDHVFEMVNQAYGDLIGDRPLIGRPALEALPELRSQGFEELLHHVYSTAEPFVGRAIKVRLQKTPEGPPVEVFTDFVYQPVLDSKGQVVGIFAQGSDVTEQVRAVDALREADQRKDEFLATLAHELRNPLAPIRQAATAAKLQHLSLERRSWAMEVIERQAGHMALLLDDLLDVSRISLGRLELRTRIVPLQEVVDLAVETVRPHIEQKRHQLSISLPHGEVRLRADPLRLAQVISNVLSNAAKYTDSGGRIELIATADAASVEIRIRDNGIGLPTESVEKIFGMFSQVESAMHRSQGGLGIGLALSRGLVQLHGGSLRAVSDGQGKGSEFIIGLPRGVAAQDDTDQNPVGQPAPVRQRRVLVADDNTDALETLAILLDMDGHTVYTASDGLEALSKAADHRPEIAILDIGMPGLSGLQVASQIRAGEWGQSLRLIALTGWGQAQDEARAHAAGFDHHCTKPVDIERLRELLR